MTDKATDLCTNCGHARNFHGMLQSRESNWCMAPASGERAKPFTSICNCQAFVEPVSKIPATYGTLTVPQYKHDCSACTFIGHRDGFDVYVCPQLCGATILARCSDEPSDYHSGSEFIISGQFFLDGGAMRASKLEALVKVILPALSGLEQLREYAKQHTTGYGVEAALCRAFLAVPSKDAITKAVFRDEPKWTNVAASLFVSYTLANKGI